MSNQSNEFLPQPVSMPSQQSPGGAVAENSMVGWMGGSVAWSRRDLEKSRLLLAVSLVRNGLWALQGAQTWKHNRQDLPRTRDSENTSNNCPAPCI